MSSEKKSTSAGRPRWPDVVLFLAAAVLPLCAAWSIAHGADPGELVINWTHATPSSDLTVHIGADGLVRMDGQEIAGQFAFREALRGRRGRPSTAVIQTDGDVQVVTVWRTLQVLAHEGIRSVTVMIPSPES